MPYLCFCFLVCFVWVLTGTWLQCTSPTMAGTCRDSAYNHSDKSFWPRQSNSCRNNPLQHHFFSCLFINFGGTSSSCSCQLGTRFLPLHDCLHYVPQRLICSFSAALEQIYCVFLNQCLAGWSWRGTGCARHQGSSAQSYKPQSPPGKRLLWLKWGKLLSVQWERMRSIWDCWKKLHICPPILSNCYRRHVVDGCPCPRCRCRWTATLCPSASCLRRARWSTCTAWPGRARCCCSWLTVCGWRVSCSASAWWCWGSTCLCELPTMHHSPGQSHYATGFGFANVNTTFLKYTYTHTHTRARAYILFVYTFMRV